MTSFIEGSCTFEIDNISELVAQEKANTELCRTSSYGRLHYATYGPFTMGEYKFEVRVSPSYGDIDFFLCFKDNAQELKKCGYIFLLQDHNSKSAWTIRNSVIPNEERDFHFFINYANISNLPASFIGCVPTSNVQNYSKENRMLVKLALWLLLDNSKPGSAPKPTLQPDKEPDLSNYTPPPSELISKLLLGQFADIHFIVKEQTFAAHRAILGARSPVFKSELLTLENDTCRNKLFVSVEHMDVLTFKYMLHFVYTDSLPSDFEESTSPERYHLMFIAAHHFEIEGLKLVCEKKLTKAITDTIVTTLKLIEHAKCGKLKITLKD